MATEELWTKVSDRVQIQDVHLIAVNARRPLEVTLNGEHEIAMTVGATPRQNGDLLRVSVKYSLEAKRKVKDGMPTESEPAAHVDALFDLTYRVSNIEGLSKEHYESFAKTNAVFNAWPYWRELVHSMMSRLGLPPYTIPVFRIPSVTPPAQAENKQLPPGTAPSN